MARPLMQMRVAQLEEMFESGKSDPKILGQLAHELEFRQVPRAVALMDKVRAALRGARGESSPSHFQLEHTSESAPHRIRRSRRLDAASGDLVSSQAEPPIRPAVHQPAPAPVAATPSMPLEEAYKALKANPGTPWESIEQTRRELVGRASPTRNESMSKSDRERFQREADHVNAAYAVLAKEQTRPR
ncbi:MAG: hypothetical protein U1F52_05375 [Burkholderiales bacterium]